MTTAEIKSTGTACLRGKREDLDNRTTSVLHLINLTNLRKFCLLVVHCYLITITFVQTTPNYIIYFVMFSFGGWTGGLGRHFAERPGLTPDPGRG